MRTFGRKALVSSAFVIISGALVSFSGARAQDGAVEQGQSSLRVQYYPRYFYDESRTPGLTLLFNQRMDRSKLEKRLFFEDGSGKAVPAEVREATEKEIGNTWSYYGGADTVSPPLDSFVTVVPSRPLPVGKLWRLVLPAGLVSGGEGQRLEQNVAIGVGTVHPFEVRGLEASNPYDGELSIDLYFSKRVSEAMGERMEQYVVLQPQPEEVEYEVSGGLVRVKASFAYGVDYLVQVRPGMLAADGLELEQGVENTVKFRPQDGFVALPDYEVAQPLSGNATFEVRSGNLRSVRVRVKSLERDTLVYAMRGYRVYDPETANDERGQRYPAFEMVPGRTIYDEELPLGGEVDRSQELVLKWPEILGKTGPAALYLSVEGESMDHPNLPFHRVGAQSLVQLTDLGLVWKKTEESALVYVFSLKTGKPVTGAEVQLVGEENEVLESYVTNLEGVTAVSLDGAHQGGRWLVAKAGEDRYATAFDPASRRGLSTWQFDVRQPWWGEPRERLRTYAFTDRGIYRPGEEVHVKVMARRADGNELRIPGEGAGFPARLLVYDGQDREVVNRAVRFGERGSLDEAFSLPEEVTGTYRIQVDFDEYLGKSKEYEEEDHEDRWLYHYISVADYRPNTFEVSVRSESAYRGGDEIEVNVSANYLRGKALSQARATWRGFYHGARFRPAGFEEYAFGDPGLDLSGSGAGEGMLDGEGGMRLPLDFLPREGMEHPVEAHVSVDVTDVNQQTISGSTRFWVHSSEFYLGVKSPRGWLSAGQAAVFELQSVKSSGGEYAEPVRGSLVVEREVVETVKVQGAGDVPRHRNERRYEEEERREFTLAAGAGKEAVTFREAGTYRLKWSAARSGGGQVETVIQCYVWGDGDVYWAHRDGDAIELMPEAESYRVGDTAKIMVRSPMLGTALVTVERAGVYRTFVKELTSKTETIEIPVTAQGSPNLFVSVLVVRGSQDSPHRYRDTEYKLGYCELEVEDPSKRLRVDLSLAKAEVRPGEEVAVKVRVQDAGGIPQRGEEVTLYVVDEGVLSLTGYETPDPLPEFHAPYPLYVRTWHTLFKVLTENPEERPFANKGLMIGGGGDGLEALRDRARKDFRATAYWNGGLVTDEHGEVDVRFAAPDSLTRFRVLAVVAGGAERFGTETGRLVVTKPVIVEPALPAFANVGDRLWLQAVAHNTTDRAGEFEVTLKMDGKVMLWKPEGEIIPAALEGGTAEAGEWRQSVRLEAGSTRALPVPVVFAEEGETVMTWTIREDAVDGEGRSDSVESRLRVGYPVPKLGAIHHLRVKPGARENLFASLERDLLQGKGEFEVTLSNSRLLEAMDALEYNLDYPYGCAEQTSSSTLPWMTMGQFERVFPALGGEPGKRERAVRAGLERLLAMQTQDGGLGYWPGAGESSFWASAYGGMVLALGVRDQGVTLPEARLAGLWDWLSERLRGAEETREAEELHQRCLALYTLALAGRAEASYHETYYQKRSLLAPESRAMLALAMLEGGTEEQKRVVPGLLTGTPAAGEPEHAVSWYGPAHVVALRLLAALRQNPDGDEAGRLTEELIRLRQPRHGWGSTYANAWPLLALAEVAKAEGKEEGKATGKLEFAGETRELSLEKAFTSVTAVFPFEGDLRGETCELEAETAGKLYARVRLTVRPEQVTSEAVNRGFGVQRSYLRLNLDGSLTETGEFEVGDLVVIRLGVDSSQNGEVYLALDDPMPAIFEAINPAYENRGAAAVAAGAGRRMPVSHAELRLDRGLFFSDRLWDKGRYEVEYLARVVAAGEVTAPPAKMEAMYEPQRYGLSATTRVRAVLPGSVVRKVAVR